MPNQGTVWLYGMIITKQEPEGAPLHGWGRNTERKCTKILPLAMFGDKMVVERILGFFFLRLAVVS